MAVAVAARITGAPCSVGIVGIVNDICARIAIDEDECILRTKIRARYGEEITATAFTVAGFAPRDTPDNWGMVT